MTLEKLLQACFQNKGRIVSASEVDLQRLVKAKQKDEMYVDESTGLGVVLLPWDEETEKDRARALDKLLNVR